jgi:hypothetical protein
VISEQHISLGMIESEILEAESHSGSDRASQNLGELRELSQKLGAKEEVCHINKEAGENEEE